MSETDLGLRLMVEYGATGLPREAADRMKALQARVEELEAALRLTLGLLDALVEESERSIGYDEEDPFRMGEWFEHEEMAVIDMARAALTSPEQQ